MAFEIIQIPRDEEGVRSYLEKYKAFRLFSLRTAPEAFGSTYAREIAFTDDVWYNRLANPETATFIALKSNHIVSTLTAVGHLSFGPEELSPSSDPWKALSGTSKELAPLHYRINGMFTLPEARGQGIAKALMARAIKYGIDEATASGRTFAGSIAVDADNQAARSLYAKCGFVPVKEEAFNGSARIVVLLNYSPGLIAASTPV